MRFIQAAHNRALDLFVASFRDPLQSSLEMARFAAPNMGRRGVKEHRAIIEAVANRDTERAKAIVAAHLERTARRVHGKVPAKGSPVPAKTEAAS